MGGGYKKNGLTKQVASGHLALLKEKKKKQKALDAALEGAEKSSNTALQEADETLSWYQRYKKK